MRHAPLPPLPRRSAAALAAALLGILPICAPGQQPPSMELRERAFGAENRGEWSAAATAYLELVEADPHNATWVASAGNCLGRSGRFSDAIKLLDQARKRFPGSLEVPAMLARTLLLKSERDVGALNPHELRKEAAEIAEKVLRIDADHEDGRLVLAQARYMLGEWDEAVRQAEEAARRHPHRPGAHILRGRIATDRMVDLLRIHETDALRGQELADLVAAIDKERKAAKASYEQAARIDPDRPHPHVMLARVALFDRKHEQVRAHLLDALAIDPDTRIDHGSIAKGIDYEQRHDLYLATLQRYSNRKDATVRKRGTLRWYAALALFDGRLWQRARDSFGKALEENPEATHSHYYLALCEYELGDHDAALVHAGDYAALSAKAFARIIRRLDAERRGQVAAVVRFLANRAYQDGDKVRSRDLNHVTALLYDTAAAWNNHAFLCRETGQHEAALSSYERALEKEPKSPQLLNDTGVVLHYHLAGDENLARAKTLYERAVECADEVLADAASSDAQKEQAKLSKSDAKKNLAKLK